jgi:succinoglycan biosynthesis transport protein ExoP
MRSSGPNQSTDTPMLTPVDPSSEQVFVVDQSEHRGLELLDYWRIVLRYRWSILGVVLIATVIGTLNALSATSIYQAQARLLVKFNAPNISNLQQFEPTPMHWLFFETQSDIIKSHAVAERVVEKLALNKALVGAGAEREPALGLANDSWGAPLRAWLAELKSWLPEELTVPEAPPLDEQGRYAALVDSILGGVTVTGGKESEVLNVNYVSADPKMAANLANTFAEAYIEFGLDSRSSNVQQATSWLGRRIEELRQKVRLSEDALREFKAREDLVDTVNREKLISANLSTLTSELIRAEAQRNEAANHYRQINSYLKQGNNYEAVASAVDSAIVSEAHRNKVILERRVSELFERYGEKHPKMIGARADLQEAKRHLKAEVDKAVNNVRKKLELVAAHESQLRDMIDRQQKKMRTVSGKAYELRQLEREVDANRSLYETFLVRFKEADVADEYDVPNARIIDRATAPMRPFKPNRERMVFLAALVGLVIGVLIALLRNHHDNTFKTKEDVERNLELPVIGMLPHVSRRSADKLGVERHVLTEPRSPFAEAVNDVRTAILFSQFDAPTKVVLITSAVQDEGKTTLASNLALTFCRRGRTLLLDGDLRKGRLQEVTNRAGQAGLTDMLSDQCSAEDAIVSDPAAENLFLLMPGTLPPNPLEVVSSKRFSEYLSRLRANFDYIIIDGTPLLPVSDSIVLAHLADATVLTVKSDDTSHDVALDALKRLRAARITAVGVVMQQVDMSKMRSYGRRYATSYGGYYGYQKTKKVG